MGRIDSRDKETRLLHAFEVQKLQEEKVGNPDARRACLYVVGTWPSRATGGRAAPRCEVSALRPWLHQIRLSRSRWWWWLCRPEAGGVLSFTRCPCASVLQIMRARWNHDPRNTAEHTQHLWNGRRQERSKPQAPTRQGWRWYGQRQGQGRNLLPVGDGLPPPSTALTQLRSARPSKRSYCTCTRVARQIVMHRAR